MSVARHTLPRPAEFELIEKKSRFRVHAAACDDPVMALAVVAAVSDRDATHNCWAYRIGQQYRFSDDGEPGGTAGRPILAAIDGQGYDQVVVVVTRHFGGIKLGAGGLVRAYGGAAAECLRRAERRVIVERRELRFRCDYADLGAVHRSLAAHAAERHDERHDASGCELVVSIPVDHEIALRRALADATRGQVAWISPGAL